MDFDVVIVRCRNAGVECELAQDLLAVLGDVRYEGIESCQGRVYIKTGDERALAAISKVPGVVSCSPAISVGSTPDEAAAFVADVAGNIARMHEGFIPRPASYLKLAPEAIGRVRGDAVFDAVRKRKPGIDLNGAKSLVHVELCGHGAYVYTGIVPGPAPSETGQMYPPL